MHAYLLHFQAFDDWWLRLPVRFLRDLLRGLGDDLPRLVHQETPAKVHAQGPKQAAGEIERGGEKAGAEGSCLQTSAPCAGEEQDHEGGRPTEAVAKVGAGAKLLQKVEGFEGGGMTDFGNGIRGGNPFIVERGCRKEGRNGRKENKETIIFDYL